MSPCAKFDRCHQLHWPRKRGGRESLSSRNNNSPPTQTHWNKPSLSTVSTAWVQQYQGHEIPVGYLAPPAPQAGAEQTSYVQTTLGQIEANNAYSNSDCSDQTKNDKTFYSLNLKFSEETCNKTVFISNDFFHYTISGEVLSFCWMAFQMELWPIPAPARRQACGSHRNLQRSVERPIMPNNTDSITW